MSEDLPFLVAFLGGILSFLSPCILPLIPGYLSYIAGIPIEKVNSNDKRIKQKIFWSSFLFILGFSLIFITLGASASGIAPVLNYHKAFLTNISGGLIIIFGFHVLGVFKIKLLYRELRFNPEINEIRSTMAPFLLGLAFGMGWTPCIGPILASVLILAANKETIIYGMTLLAIYAIGMGIPFLIVAFAMSCFLEKIIFLKRNLYLIEKIAGIFLILTGIFIMIGELQSLGGLILDYFPFVTIFG